MKSCKQKILIATGGTGGHIFPAQALASSLTNYTLLFAGGNLSQNPYFDSIRFRAVSVTTDTPFSKKPLKIFRAILRLTKGIFQSLKLIREFDPDIVVGFGSFYTFPILFAAVCKKKKIVLFEPNAIPGKVTRLFSKWALCSTLQFGEAGRELKGKTVEVNMPLIAGQQTDRVKARSYFYLDPEVFTFLIFGGSQGAASINDLFLQTAPSLNLPFPYQVIHLTGRNHHLEQIRKAYIQMGVKACVKTFEERINLAWSGADLVICRAGGGTLSEHIAFEVPAIFIPFPGASDDHQKHNAMLATHKIKGSIMHLSPNPSELKMCIEKLVCSDHLRQLKQGIISFKDSGKDSGCKKKLAEVVSEYLNT